MTLKLIHWPPYTHECRYELTSMSVHTHLTEVLTAEMEGDNMCTDTKKEMSVSRGDRRPG